MTTLIAQIPDDLQCFKFWWKMLRLLGGKMSDDAENDPA